MAVKQNQGFRIDLNFEENTNDVLSLSNLAGVGVAGDLRVIQNNLRNTSYLAFNSVDLTTNEFIFSTDKVLNINSIKSEVFDTTSSLVTVTTTVPYNTYRGEPIILENVTTSGTGSTIFNGQFVAQSIGVGGTFFKYKVNNALFDSVADSSDLTNAKITFKSGTQFVYTDDDVVTVSQSVSVGSTTLNPGIEYFICNSDSETKFKLSFTSSTVGTSIINITSTPTQFDFIRKELVTQPNLINFTEPDVQDNEEFGSYLRSSINNVFESTQANVENAGYFITKKYKGTDNTTTNEEIKFEGTVNLFDPGQFNTTVSALNDSQSPGIFIGETRAFSTDNNPWTIDGTNLKTNSEEVTAGELLFASDITITGTSQISGSEVDIESFTHKIPVTINGETYYLLMIP
jgi:hypothetical protein